MDELKPPLDWGDDDVTKFLNLARANAFASFVNYKGTVVKIIGIDGVYKKIVSTPIKKGVVSACILSQKAHPAFLASVQLAMNTQVTEAYCQMRSVLEFVLYAYFLAKRSELTDVWMRREENAETLRDFKNKFRITHIFNLLKEELPDLGAILHELYEHTIRWGAHPNPNSLFGVLAIKEGEEVAGSEVSYLAHSPESSAMCLRNVAQVGVAWLKVLQLIIPDKFTPEIQKELDMICEGL